MDPRILFKPMYFSRFCLWASAWLLPAIFALSATPHNRLQTLVNDTAAQIQLAYRQHPAEREHRQAEIAAVLTAWRAAARNEANNERLATWLQAAILSSMPGSRDPLPPAPTFAANSKIEPRPTASASTTKVSAISDTKPDVDPFRDDPATERE